MKKRIAHIDVVKLNENFKEALDIQREWAINIYNKKIMPKIDNLGEAYTYLFTDDDIADVKNACVAYRAEGTSIVEDFVSELELFLDTIPSSKTVTSAGIFNRIKNRITDTFKSDSTKSYERNKRKHDFEQYIQDKYGDNKAEAMQNALQSFLNDAFSKLLDKRISNILSEISLNSDDFTSAQMKQYNRILNNMRENVASHVNNAQEIVDVVSEVASNVKTEFQKEKQDFYDNLGRDVDASSKKFLRLRRY